MPQIVTALIQYGLPTLLLAAVSWAFWTFLQRRDREYSQLIQRHSETVVAKDKEIARLNEARVKEQAQAAARNAQIAQGALEMTQALASVAEDPN